MEEWKDIKDYEGLYQVSSCGRVKSLNYRHAGTEKILKQSTDKSGYKVVSLSQNNKMKAYKVHRLVATAFLDNPNDYKEINHIDECKYNNFVENLEWCTHKYNANYGTRKERISKAMTGENGPMYGKHHTNETRAKMSKAKIGKILSKEHKIKISNSLAGANNPNARKIQCMNTEEIFNTLKDASKWSGTGSSNIIKQIKGKRKSAGKHPVTKEPLQWKYID